MTTPANNPNGTLNNPRMRWGIGASMVGVCLLLFIRCVNNPRRSTQPALKPYAGADCIIVAGERIPIGTRVVTWQEPNGYSAYRRGKHFDRSKPADGKPRYSQRSDLPPGMQGNNLSHNDLKQVVHQFVLHYDTCGCSRQCFKVLQDVRTLSVHFMLDVDGTIYQTLDLREKAWHATTSNNFGVGIEIAHPGSWLSPLNADMRRWYEQDEQGWRQKFPKWMPETGLQTKGFVPRPDRPKFVSGRVNGVTYHQFDFTSQQYEALPKLMAALNKALPRIRLDAPRDARGEIIDRALPASTLRGFDGVVGHFHVQVNKRDPGPAFQWERVLREARELRAR
ncbi:MAG: N-acetylmuramoyl-L-alanine amidase [Planctomycetota bacterium]|jgi:N-acetylmuramoyl-L-alanine amidase